MAKEAIDKRRTVLFGTISRKGVVDSPIAVELLNQARHRKTQANSTNGRPFLDRVSKHTSRPNHEQKTVSVAGLFKKNSKHATRNGRNKRKEPTPEPEMMDLVCGGIEEARNSIAQQTTQTLSSTHEHFQTTIAKSRAADEKFHEAITDYVNTLTAPLTEEEVETVTRNNGKTTTSVVNIGERVTGFSEIVDTESANLKELWEQWDALQKEYLEQGAEVFGPEKFGQEAEMVKGKGKGFEREMELIDGDFDTVAEELREEIIHLAANDLQKMKSSERELESMIKKEQAKMLASMVQSE